MTEAQNQQRFTDLFADAEQQLYRFVFSLLGNHADTEDVLQETLQQLWEHFDDYDADRPFLPWATQFAYRRVLMHRRRGQTRRKYFSDAVVEMLAAERPRQAEHAMARTEALGDCLARLEADDRLIVRHRYESDADLTDLAHQTGRTVNSLYKRLQRVRARLLTCIRTKLQRQGIEA